MNVWEVIYYLSWTDGKAIVLANSEDDAIYLVKQQLSLDNLNIESALKSISELNPTVRLMGSAEEPAVLTIIDLNN